MGKLVRNGITYSGKAVMNSLFEGLDWDNAETLTLPDNTGYTYTPTKEGVFMSTSYGSVGGTIIERTNYDDMFISYRNDTWSTGWIPVTTDTYTLKRAATYDSYPSGSWIKFIPWKITQDGGGGGSGSVDYSTAEHKIGTWIDGKDVYEKTYSITPSSSPSDWTEIEAIGIDTFISYEMQYVISNGQVSGNDGVVKIAYNPPNDPGKLCYYFTNSNIVSFITTVKYTKTSI